MLFAVRYAPPVHRLGYKVTLYILVSFIIYLVSNYEKHKASIKNRRFHRFTSIGGI